jgi:hypothetical protein
MKSVKVREVTAYESRLCEMMVSNMKRLPPTLEPKCEVRMVCEPGVRP